MQAIPLSKLTLSSTHNVRKTDRDRNLDELIASIQSHGLLENLLVVQADDCYEVIAGGRRLAAFQALLKEGRVPADHPISCELVSGDSAHEISLAENSVREAMHPADQFEAWAKLCEQGMSIAEVAARFGTRDDLVRQRLKLGRVAPQLLQAYRDEDISLEVLMAYTLTDDHDRQVAVYEGLKQSWSGNSPGTVRRALTGHAVSSRDARAKLIGVDAYEAAGGILRRDLFEEECYFEDPELLDRLVLEKLQETADELAGTWAWVEVRPTCGYEELREFRRIFPHALAEVPKELLQQHDDLSEQLEELHYQGSDWESQAEECQRIEQEMEQVQFRIDAYHGFTEEEREIAGCIVSLGWNGIEIQEGLVRAEDAKQWQTLSGEDNGDDAARPVKPRYSQSLHDSLQHYRLHPLRLALASDFKAAFDAAVYAMCCRRFGHSSELWLGVRADQYHYPARMHDDETIASMREAEDDAFGRLPLAWLNEEDDEARFAAFCALTLEEKQRLFAACVATSLVPQLSTDVKASPVFEAIGRRLQVDVARHWRPTSDNFLKRIPKSELMAIGAVCISESWPAKYQKAKKGELVSVLHDAFNAPESTRYSPSQRDALARWLPEGMAYSMDTQHLSSDY